MTAKAPKAHSPNVSVVSPQDRGLPAAGANSQELIPELGASPADLMHRVHANTHDWLPTQFLEPAGAFCESHSATSHRYRAPQTANLIAPWQLMAVYDREHDAGLLTMARRAADWLYQHLVVKDRMEVVIGGVRDNRRTGELWTKYSAEFVLTNVALYRRTHEEEYLHRAFENSEFLIQSATHGFAPRYDRTVEAWAKRGRRSFGRTIEAFLDMGQVTGDRDWQERAVHTGEFALTLQADDGCFYLVDDEYFSTDLVADELRSLILLSQHTARPEFLHAARRFAGWLLGRQNDDGSWPLTVDRFGHVVVPTVGSGDMPNIAMALLCLHEVTRDPRYRQAALRAQRFGLGTQVLPGSDEPFSQDPRVLWGFWSWSPHHDNTLSLAQSTHHVRGMLFLLDTGAHISEQLAAAMEI